MLFYKDKYLKSSNVSVIAISLILYIASFNSNAAILLTWDWDQQINNVDSVTSIDMWATLSHHTDSTIDLPYSLDGVSIITGTLIDNGGYSSVNPYTFTLNPTIWDDLDFSSTPLKLGESVQFLYGTLTPKAGVSSGTYSTTNIDLAFSSSIWVAVESDFIVNVTAVPVPSGIILFSSGLIGLFRVIRRRV